MFLRIARLVPANGIVFAVLVFVSTLLTGDSPDDDSSNAKWTSYYADSGNRRKEEIAFFLIAIAVLCFLQFLGSLRGALARAEGEPARITTAAIASGAVFGALLLAAAAAGRVPAFAVSDYGDHLTQNPDTERLFSTLGNALFVASLFAAASMALAVATVAFVMRVFPMWLALLSALAVVAGILGFLFVPFIIVLVWVLAMSVWLLLAGFRPAAGAGAPAT